MIGALPDGLQATRHLPAGERPTQTSVEPHIEDALGSSSVPPTQSLWEATQT